MPIPYLLTTLLYTFVALLAAADASLVSMSVFSAFPALRWVRVHFITYIGDFVLLLYWVIN